MKRIVTVQDISCVGKCSLTVALPILSAMGIETAVIPTAVLSAHTAFDGFTFRDLTEDIPAILHHWKQENFHFDGIYTGYLGSVQQIRIVESLIDDFADKDAFTLVDPVMGDNGKLYTGFDTAFALEMKKLCAKADVIVPNLTEACAMLGKQYPQQYDETYIQELLKELSALGCNKIVLTGVRFTPEKMGVMAYDKEKDAFYSYFRDTIAKNFHGTGDVFASTLSGGLIRHLTLEDALKLAVDFTVSCIEATIKDENATWYGVNFEEVLPLLIERI
jgi:pyridoxine kinase